MILFLTNSYPDFPDSFRGHFVKKLALGVKKSGFPVVVVTPRVFKDSLAHQAGHGDIEVFRFLYPSGDRQLLYYKKIPYFRMIIYLLSGLFTTLKIAKARACKAIHAHWVVPTGLIGVAAGKLLRIPVVVHARGSDIHTYATKGKLLKILTKWILDNACSLIATSFSLKKIIIQEFSVPSERITVIPTGIDTDVFSPAEKGQESALLKQNRIIFVGGLNKMKGVLDLLDAVEKIFPIYPKLHLTIVGDGPLKEKILDRVSSMKFESRVTLTGPVPPEKVSELFRQSGIFVLPSYKEGTPNSLLEAMACGLPSIASCTGEIPSIIENEKDGLLCNPGVSGDILEKLKLLIEDHALYEKIAWNCRKKAFQYEQEMSLNKVLSIYRSLVDRDGIC